MSNKQNGNRFEQELALKLADAGFWVHVMQQNKAGQPADIIVAGKYACTLIDCKDVESGASFRLSRVEENQKHAMERFQQRTDRFCWFAIRFSDGEIFMLSWDYIWICIHEGLSSVSRSKMEEDMNDREEWVMNLRGWIRKYRDGEWT